ncbi:MAG TPA: hypothetical protein VGJ18_15595 [Gemmatimonadaceae bacterium]
MALFKPSAQLGRCDECRRLFDPVYGGACANCGRLLCPVHLHGDFWRRFVARWVPRQRVLCVQCRGESK